MKCFFVHESGYDLVFKTQYFFVDVDKIIDGDTDDMENLLMVRDDYKIAQYRNKFYRVCQVEIEDEDRPFIKIWREDPFKGFEGYEPLPEGEFDEPEYAI